MYLNFPKARYWVRGFHLFAYLFWRWKETRRSQQPFREMIRAIWAPKWRQVVDKELVYAEKQATKLEIQTGWIRFPTDGTRIQVFDIRGDRICKVTRENAVFSTIRKEIEIRSFVAGLAPTILRTSLDGSAFVEEWVPGHGVPYSLDILIEVLGKLQKYLYRIEYVHRKQYLCLLEVYGRLTNEEEHLLNCALSALPEDLLPVSQVHGDLVFHNMRYNLERGVLLLDWEYSRKCLVTYDCWLYLYDHYRTTDYEAPLPDEFPFLLNQLFKKMNLNYSPRDVLVLHLIHLIERCTFLRNVSPVQTASIRQVMKTDMSAVLMDLRI